MLKLRNRATSVLASAINDTTTTIPVAAATGSRFPTLGAGDWFPLVVVNASGGYEIMHVTARTGDVMTVERGREGTAPLSFDVGARADLRLTEAAIAEIFDGITTAQSDITDMRGELNAPAGTRMVFQQSVAPLGWNKDASLNDRALRVVSGTTGHGGVYGFSTVFSKTATDSTTLVEGTIPFHAHTGITSFSGEHQHVYVKTRQVNSAAQAGAGADPNRLADNDFTLPGGNHFHTVTTNGTGGGEGHAHGMDIRVAYSDVIVAQRAA